MFFGGTQCSKMCSFCKTIYLGITRDKFTTVVTNTCRTKYIACTQLGKNVFHDVRPKRTVSFILAIGLTNKLETISGMI